MKKAKNQSISSGVCFARMANQMLEQLVLDLTNPNVREKALHELSKVIFFFCYMYTFRLVSIKLFLFEGFNVACYTYLVWFISVIIFLRKLIFFCASINTIMLKLCKLNVVISLNYIKCASNWFVDIIVVTLLLSTN